MARKVVEMSLQRSQQLEFKPDIELAGVVPEFRENFRRNYWG